MSSMNMLSSGTAEPTPLPWSSRRDISGDKGSTLSSGKKSEVGESAMSLGSSHRIQSSKVPKLKAWLGFMSVVNSSLGSVYGETRVLGEDGDGSVEL